MKYFFFAIFFIISCQRQSRIEITKEHSSISRYSVKWKSFTDLGYETVKEWPHDVSAYTQGLVISQGEWLEGTGGHGSTRLRRVEKETGKVLQEKALLDAYFGEGITELNGKIYQLTWKNQVGFVYDATTLAWQKNFSYQGEGWGLTTDGECLIMSNGTEKLRFLDAKTFRVLREVTVTDAGRAVPDLNELEWVEGEIFANVWMTDQIVRIAPQDGKVLGRIDLRDLSQRQQTTNPDHVLNGIAYDAAKQELFVTGKCWPRIYQIRLIERK
jgi:glutaminyl-peptide cyclotransferase